MNSQLHTVCVNPDGHQAIDSDRVFGQRVDEVFRELDEMGVVCLNDIVSKEKLRGMQKAFEARLTHLRWSNVDGYEKTERFRHMVQDVLTLDQGFLDAALHPIVKQVLQRYIGDAFALNEAKGWKSLATKRDFHGWHGDRWYDQEVVDHIPREVKLVIYLTDVRSGAFHFIKKTHRKKPPRDFDNNEISEALKSQIVEMPGPAGTAILFDTSGIHRQGSPILEPRQAVFLNYHDATVRIQHESLLSYRYHPLILNAAFLGGLSVEDQRILGFGDRTLFQPAFVGKSRFERFRRITEKAYDVHLFVNDLAQHVSDRVKRIVRR